MILRMNFHPLHLSHKVFVCDLDGFWKLTDCLIIEIELHEVLILLVSMEDVEVSPEIRIFLAIKWRVMHFADKTFATFELFSLFFKSLLALDVLTLCIRIICDPDFLAHHFVWYFDRSILPFRVYFL